MYGKSTSLHTLWPGDVFALTALLCWPSCEFRGQELSGTDLPLFSFGFFEPDSDELDCELCSEPIFECEYVSLSATTDEQTSVFRMTIINNNNNVMSNNLTVLLNNSSIINYWVVSTDECQTRLVTIILSQILLSPW